MLNDFSKTARLEILLIGSGSEGRERERREREREREGERGRERDGQSTVRYRRRENEKTVNVVGAALPSFLPSSANERGTFYGAELSSKV